MITYHLVSEEYLGPVLLAIEYLQLHRYEHARKVLLWAITWV